MRNKKAKLNSNNLKDVLWETLQSIKTGKIPTKEANAIASNARAICSVVKLELQMSKLSGKGPSTGTTKFIDTK